jgi:hypothetical protein
MERCCMNYSSFLQLLTLAYTATTVKSVQWLIARRPEFLPS